MKLAHAFGVAALAVSCHSGAVAREFITVPAQVMHVEWHLCTGTTVGPREPVDLLSNCPFAQAPGAKLSWGYIYLVLKIEDAYAGFVLHSLAESDRYGERIPPEPIPRPYATYRWSAVPLSGLTADLFGAREDRLTIEVVLDKEDFTARMADRSAHGQNKTIRRIKVLDHAYKLDICSFAEEGGFCAPYDDPRIPTRY